MSKTFKARLAAGEQLIGLWSSLGSAFAAEVCAASGMDWLLIDSEHAPNDLCTIVAQLQALGGYPVEAAVRPPSDAPWMLKQILDAGARTLLVPMVETAEQARAVTLACRYPPRGIRGVGGSSRATRFGLDKTYLHSANDDICLMLQIESRRAIDGLDEMLEVPGVDGYFIGPADLAADMGYLGNIEHPDVQKVIEQTIVRIKNAGKVAGILIANPKLAHRYLELGARFVAVGSDVGVLVNGVSALSREFRAKAAQQTTA